MDRVVDELTRRGGVATFGELRLVASERRIRQAVVVGSVLRRRRGRYCLPLGDDTRRIAHEMTATVSHRSAAVAHGWALKHAPTRPEVTVPRNRKVGAPGRRAASVHWADLSPRDVVDGMTDPLRTVIDCARTLPFDEALAVADSALRSRDVRAAQLRQAVSKLRGPGRRQAARVAEHASPKAANPFESVLRAISLDVPGLRLVPQRGVLVAGVRIVPDLVDLEAGLVVEADSYTFHTSRRQLVTDCWRYDELVLAGWRVLRFTWDQVMFEPGWVRSVLLRAVGQTGSAPQTSRRTAKPAGGPAS
ncbi:MAG: endonuclease domain-containing protein [Humibacillus sp.]|nr:endonuclease domain-containing protein [Humibacillus sp.]MDN5776223.1 endonuclease domain-containing protein [Humibacillus sp.]